MRFPDIDDDISDVDDVVADDDDVRRVNMRWLDMKEKRKPAATDIVSTALSGGLSILLLTGLPIQSYPEERIRNLCVAQFGCIGYQ